MRLVGHVISTDSVRIFILAFVVFGDYFLAAKSASHISENEPDLAFLSTMLVLA